MTIHALCPTSGPYGDMLRRACETLQDDARAGSAVRLLDLLVHEGSEHTLSLAVRSLRVERSSTAEARFREAAKRLRERNQAQDEVAARILELAADLVGETILAAVIARVSPASKPKAA